MKVGDYVRFKDKRGNTYIRKIVEMPEDNRYASIYIDKDANYSNGLSPKNIIKSSPNKLDLIEEGDYVNGRIVVWIGYNFVALGKLDYAYEKDIKSIVTKEQFESIEYKIYE